MSNRFRMVIFSLHCLKEFPNSALKIMTRYIFRNLQTHSRRHAIAIRAALTVPCQALLNRITVEIDMKLDMLSYLKGVIVPGRNIQNTDYNRVFDETTKRIYEVITGRDGPESVKVM